MDDLSSYYEILGLEPGASPDKVRHAYRDLVQVWHPDRFEHNPRLRKKAEERIKEINEAYGRLNSGGAATKVRREKRYAKRRYSGTQKREFFRVEYPIKYRPKLVIAEDENEYDVVDISERGVKFLSKGGEGFEDNVEGTITFHDGESLDVVGKVLRRANNKVVLSLVQKIPFRRIIKEQRYLINKLWLYSL